MTTGNSSGGDSAAPQRPNGLALALRVAQSRRDAERQRLAEQSQALEQARLQFEQLAQYATDSDARWLQQAAGRTGIEVLRHREHFMARLLQAAGLQQGAVAEHDRQVVAQRNALRDAEVRCACLERLLAQRAAEAAARGARLAQKSTDALAALQFRSSSSTRQAHTLSSQDTDSHGH